VRWEVGRWLYFGELGGIGAAAVWHRPLRFRFGPQVQVHPRCRTQTPVEVRSDQKHELEPEPRVRFIANLVQHISEPDHGQSTLHPKPHRQQWPNLSLSLSTPSTLDRPTPQQATDRADAPLPIHFSPEHAHVSHIGEHTVDTVVQLLWRNEWLRLVVECDKRTQLSCWKNNAL